MVISHNMLAMNADRMLNLNTTAKSKSTEKLSSGYKVNRAADDAAGLAISEKMRRMIRGLNQGTKNTQDGISWIQIADGAMSEVHDMLHRMTELSVKSANGTNTDFDRQAINSEYQQLIKQIDQIDSSTEFNTMNVFLQGNVQLAVSGDPADLEVFDATYDSNNRLVTYGGLKFHGERIRWDEIDPKMVSTVDGKQVFNEGTYKFNNSSVNSNYYFEVMADGTSEVPMIKRNIELKADGDGIQIDGYKISWNDIGLNTAAPVSGSYFAEYGNSTLEIKIGDIVEIKSIDDIIESINSKNDGVFDYQWITTCIGVGGEKAVNMYSPNMPGGNYNRVEIVNDNMAKNTNCNATASSDPTSKLEYTIVLNKNGSNDPSQQTIYLVGSVGGKIAGSEKTLASLGITSWDSDSSIKANKEYTYKDTSGTGVEFNFTLSDITCFDSVEDGLSMVKLGGVYSTSYNNNVISSNSSVVVKDQSTFYDVKTFDQEIQLGRDFDKRNYELQNDAFSYDSANQRMGFSIHSVISGKPNLYNATLSTSNAENNIVNSIDVAADRMYQWKLQQAINNSSTHKTYNESSQKTDLTIGSGSTWVRYGYDRNEYLNSLDKALNVEMIKTSDNPADIPTNQLKDYYMRDESGKYVNAEDYLKKLVDDTIKALVSPRIDEEGKYYVNITSVVTFNSWRLNQLASPDIKAAVRDGVANDDPIVEYVNRMDLLVEKNSFDTEDELREAVKNGILSDGDYSKFRLKDDAELYKVKVSFNQGDVSFGNSSLDSKSEYIVGRLDTYPPSSSMLSTGMNSQIDDTIQNYSQYVMQQISNASSYSVYKDESDTTAAFVGDEFSNTAIRAFYNSDMEITPIERGIVIQHSSILDDCTTIPQFALNTSILGIRSTDVSTELQSKHAMGRISSALAYVSEKRSILGAFQNRLEHTIKNNDNKSENLTAAESQIRDTDMATEMVKFSNHNVLEQIGQSMLAQANQFNQAVLALL